MISSYEHDLPLNDPLLSRSPFVSLNDGILPPVLFEYAQIKLSVDTSGLILDDEPTIDPLTYVSRYNDNTCLHIVGWRRGHFGTELRGADLLLKAGADVNVIGKWGDTPRHVAYRMGCDDLAKLLLKHGASTTIKNDVGMTPDECKEAGTAKLSEEELEELWVFFKDNPTNYDDLDVPVDPLTYVDGSGDTCLHSLAWRSTRETCGVLVDAEVETNISSDRHVIVVISIDFLGSDWVQREVKMALDEADKRDGGYFADELAQPKVWR